VNEEKEDPDFVDSSRLKILSSRKLWKINHGIKLKKRNKRQEKRGVF
jgi:ATP-dependent RNA helicase DDX56/DBP9